MGGSFLGGISSAQLSGFLTALLVITFLGLSSPVYAEEITYTGDGKKLKESPAWFLKSIHGLLFPGTTGAPLSLNNKVTVNYTPGAPETENPVFVFGGLSESAAVGGNSVVFLNGSTNYISGGDSNYGNVVDNAVTLSGGNVENISGGYSIEGAVTDNMVTISGGIIVEEIVYGGFSHKGNVTGNMVTTNGGIVGEYVFGGFGHKGRVTCNNVTVKEGKMDYVYGGSSYGDAADNSVAISGGVVGASVYGGRSRDGDVSGNKIIISGGSVADNVYGGYGGEGSSVKGNAVTISGGSVAGNVHGGSSNGDVSGNTIIISDGSVGIDVRGGESFRGDAANNSVNISGGSIGRKVYGGWSDEGSATGNTVTISGSPNLKRTYIFGGRTEVNRGDSFSGNILRLKNSGISVKGIGDFEYYNFDLPENLTVDAVMLSVTDKVNLAKTTVEIFLQDGAKLKKGDKIALIHSAEGISDAPKNKSCKVKHGGAIYEFSIYTDKNNLWAEVKTVSNAAKQDAQ